MEARRALKGSSGMIPLSKEEWLESLPPGEEDEADSPVELAGGSPSLKKETLSRRTLSKLPSELPTRSQADWDNSEATTDAGDGEIRAMGGFEGFFGKAVPCGLGCIYYVAELEGPVDNKLMEHALRQSVKRHPNLRTRIVNHRYMESIPYEECPVARVRVVQTDDVFAWTEERLHKTPIKAGTELYMWEIFLHQSPPADSDSDAAGEQGGKNHLVLFAHHTILDGDSILKLLQELVVTMAKLAPMSDKERRSDIQGVEPMRQLPSQDELLYENYRGYFLIYHFRSLLKELVRVLRIPRVPPAFRYTTDWHERITRIIPLTIPGEMFKRLMAACKREGTTVTGALSAACMREIQKHIPHKDYVMKLEVLVNFRATITGIQGVDDALQLFAAPVDVMVEGGQTPEPSFWDVARHIKTDIDDFAKQPHQIIDTLDFFRTLAFHPISWPFLAGFARSFLQGRYKAVSLSNMGRTDGRFTPCGDFRIGRIHMGIDETIFGHTFFLAAASYGGDLQLTLSYPDPIVDRSLAQEYAKGIIRQCEEAATSAVVPPGA